MTQSSPNLVNVLRSTLERLEKAEDLASDDPALNELKESILSNITELEVAKTPKTTASPQRILWISKKACADVKAAAKPDPAPGASTEESSPSESLADKTL